MRAKDRKTSRGLCVAEGHALALFNEIWLAQIILLYVCIDVLSQEALCSGESGLYRGSVFPNGRPEGSLLAIKIRRE